MLGSTCPSQPGHCSFPTSRSRALAPHERPSRRTSPALLRLNSQHLPNAIFCEDLDYLLLLEPALQHCSQVHRIPNTIHYDVWLTDQIGNSMFTHDRLGTLMYCPYSLLNLVFPFNHSPQTLKISAGLRSWPTLCRIIS